MSDFTTRCYEAGEKNHVENLLYPLSHQELLSIRKGDTVQKHYHLPHIRIPTLLVVVATFKHQPQEFHEIRKRGISVTSIVLDSNRLDQIEKGEGVSAEYGHFRLMILSEKSMKKLIAESR